MFGKHFYHQRTRRAVAMFGRLFNDIYVIRKDSTGQIHSQMKVPLSYATRDKTLVRINEQADLVEGQRVAIKLPRMSFEITGVAYDAARALQKVNQYGKSGTANTKRTKIKQYVPYIMNFQLNVFAKTQDDALQVVEQIIPYFSPQYTLTLKPFDDYTDIKEDVPVTLTGVTFSDDYEGAMETRRTIIYTMDFEMKVNFYGPLNEGDIIRKTTLKLDTKTAGITDSDVATITITPSPVNVSPDSDYGFTITTDYYNDSA